MPLSPATQGSAQCRKSVNQGAAKNGEGARNPDLKNAFIEHLEQTKGHLERLKQVAEKLGKRLAGHTCAAMKGLIEEGSEWIGEDAAAEVMDAGIIAAPSVEHYEMAGYGTVQTFAKLLGEKEAAELFTLTLNEEKAADKKLSLLAKSINVKAKTEKPPANVKTAVKEPAKLPVKIPSGAKRGPGHRK
jgi:ferritin-like metal-binding protein YciE